MKTGLCRTVFAASWSVLLAWSANAAPPSPALPGSPQAAQPLFTQQAAQPSRNPFGNLFRPTAPATGAQIEQPRVRCGMTLVPVDPKFDSRIRKQAPTHPVPSARTSQPRCEK